MIVEIQCLPSPAGTPENPYAFIDDAIKVVVTNRQANSIANAAAE